MTYCRSFQRRLCQPTTQMANERHYYLALPSVSVGFKPWTCSNVTVKLVDLGIARWNLRVAVMSMTTETSERNKNATDNNEQKWNSKTNSNDKDYQQRKAISDWCPKTDGKGPAPNKANKLTQQCTVTYNHYTWLPRFFWKNSLNVNSNQLF